MDIRFEARHGGRALVLFSLLLAIFLSNCSSTAKPPSAPDTATLTTAKATLTTAKATLTAAKSNWAIPVDPPLDVNGAALTWRWIGIKSDPKSALCPKPTSVIPGTWSTSHLFSNGPSSLRRYCMYEGGGPDSAAAELKALVTSGKLIQVAPDSMAVAGAGALNDAIWGRLHDHFLDQAGDVALPLPTGSGRVPRLALLDTAATRVTNLEEYRGNSHHGFTLINMAKDLLCDASGTGCLATVAARLALAYEAFDSKSQDLSVRNEPEGGIFGTIAELARAIREEVHLWESAPAKRHLILNLSVAWEERFGGTESAVGKMPPSVRAVYDALVDASCRGVLVVAAAGNVGGGPDREVGPLLPAAWERIAAPGYGQCKRVLGADPGSSLFPSSGETPYRPLIYAVGGVGSTGVPLANARQQGEPRQVAYGDHAVVAAPSSSGPVGPTGILTGTSVSALVTSAAAAAVWAYRDELRSDEVMELIYSAGDGLDRGADFCLGGSRETPCSDSETLVRRASVCASVESACSSGACGSTSFSCDGWPADIADLNGVDLDPFQNTSPMTTDLSTYATTFTPIAECQGETLTTDGTTPTDPCPHHQYYSMHVERWTSPQPECEACSSCYIEFHSPGNLFIEINDDFVGQLTNPTLKIGEDLYNLTLGSPFLEAGDTAVISNVPMPASDETPVLLSFTLDGDQSTSSALLVLRY